MLFLTSLRVTSVAATHCSHPSLSLDDSLWVRLVLMASSTPLSLLVLTVSPISLAAALVLQVSTSPPLSLLVLLVPLPVATTLADSYMYLRSLRISRPCPSLPPPPSLLVLMVSPVSLAAVLVCLSCLVSTSPPPCLPVLVQVLPALRAYSPRHRYMYMCVLINVHRY